MNNTFGKMTLRGYQGDAHNCSITHVREQISNYKKNNTQPEPAVVSGYVGCGKTLLIGALANHCSTKNLKCLIMARQGELIRQNSDECFNMAAPTSIYSASLNSKSTHYGSVAGTEGTIANALETDFANWLPLIIMIDECHMVDWEDFLNGGQSQFTRILRHFNMLADRLQYENPDKLIPRPVVIGFTGTPYRGTESIIGPYWKKQLCEVGREFLVDNGFLVPTIFGFGHDDVQYNFDGFNENVDEVGTKDFTSSQLDTMRQYMEISTTHKIMREVIEATKNRLGVLITCAGIKHCQEAAEVLPAGTWAIVTSETPDAERMAILDKAKSGEIKYVLQIGCLTTGVNVPYWDTSVILRRIGSLTLLVQLLGRGMRLLKPEQADAGLVKEDHLVLDYAGTMPAMINMFQDPMLEEAELSRARDAFEIIHCPICATENSEHARRCIGRDGNGNRCEHFWKSRACEDLMRGEFVISKGCGAENDIAARFCRECGNTLIDPNASLTGKHYTDADWKPVIDMKMEVTGKGGTGIKVSYFMDSYDVNGNQEVAKVNYWVINDGGIRVWKSKFLANHVVGGWGMVSKVAKMKPTEILVNQRLFKKPDMITHRVNGKGESIVNTG
ncbi:P-loop containing nucleoside triphosphate hydrolase [Vibrio phage 1.076.O._10N.286.51.B7]|nr:P-loop containing nucleoside triphosphate hydrolase [Vibrio phage 1.076.O._10N.286.51.B7]